MSEAGLEQAKQHDTQKEIVLNHLKRHGNITSWDAISYYHVTRLSEYIRALKEEGHNIQSVWEENNGKRYVRYFLQPAECPADLFAGVAA